MTVQFVPATRAAAKARIALAGPSGAGKTYTGLALACGLSDRVAVIDTERGSASKYVGLNNWAFDTLAPTSFSPQSLSEALAVASAGGYGCVLVDSLSHYWMGVDGMLEQVDRRAKGGNNFSGWKEARPDERRMIDALVSYPGHVVVTLRVKTEYVIEKDDRGKSVPRKVGLRPEQREGIEYEFDVIGDLDLDNNLVVSKTRIPMLHGAVIPKPGPELAETIRDWLADGEEVAGPLAYRAEALDPDTDRSGLLQLLETVRSSGLTNAPVTDGEGAPTTLERLIIARGRAIDAAAQPAGA
ncbi:ATP-binding protein [Pseudonocardia alni]|uniref:ATP-binding protein n=1 Tax=Pseudonocardia alni TaxID=33907 RepID=UPI0033234AB9